MDIGGKVSAEKLMYRQAPARFRRRLGMKVKAVPFCIGAEPGSGEPRKEHKGLTVSLEAP